MDPMGGEEVIAFGFKDSLRCRHYFRLALHANGYYAHMLWYTALLKSKVFKSN